MMSINKACLEPIKIENFKGSFSIGKDILDILDFSEDIILWRKTDQDIILFSKEKRMRFVKEMKKKSEFTEAELEYGKNGRNFVRFLYCRAQPVVLQSSNRFYISKNCSMRKFLEGKDFSVSFCV